MGSVAWLRHNVYRATLAVVAGIEPAIGPNRAILRRPRMQFLCLHDVPEDRVARFRQMLKGLSSEYVLLSFGDAIQRMRRGQFNSPAVIFTFDDGLHNQLAAARVLEEFGVRGCFYVCTAAPAHAAASGDEFCRTRLRRAPTRLMDWNDIEALRSRGHDIGCHTVSHMNLARCDSRQLSCEIHEARAVLLKRLGTAEHFAWPWGRWKDFSAEAAREVFDAGFATCASTERGCHDAAPSTGSLCIRRMGILADWSAQDLRPLLARAATRGGSGTWPAGWAVERGAA